MATVGAVGQVRPRRRCGGGPTGVSAAWPATAEVAERVASEPPGV